MIPIGESAPAKASSTDDAAPPGSAIDYDTVIIGGALSGAATAIAPAGGTPGCGVLIIEKSERFTRRVGEATVEVSAYFLGRVLGMTQYLNEAHLVKQGLRFWFTNEEVESLAEASELGAATRSGCPLIRLDRATFDEEVLRRACALGRDAAAPGQCAARWSSRRAGSRR